MKTVLILGGGFLGLRIAYLLKKLGHRPILVEKGDRLGGMVQTFCRSRDGGLYRFDYGPHLFFNEYRQEYEALIGEDLRPLVDRFLMWTEGRFLSYPIRLGEVLSHMGVVGSADALWEVARNRAFGERMAREGDDLEAFMTNRFGKRLFETFYSPYIEKCTGLSIGETSVQWAQERTNVTGNGLISTLVQKALSLVSRRTGTNDPTAGAISAFYPRLGSGQICDAMARDLAREDVHLRTEILSLTLNNSRVSELTVRTDAGSRSLTGDLYISTIPLPGLFNAFRPALDPQALQAAQALRYRGLRLVNLILDRPRALGGLEVFSMDPDQLFKRVYEPKAMSPDMAPPGRTSLCLEVCESEGDPVSRMTDGDLIQSCLRGLKDMGAILSDREVLDSFIVRMSHAYPVYRRGFAADRDRLLDRISSIQNLVTSGRQGLFRYHAMTNETMAMAADVVQWVEGFQGSKTGISGASQWGRNFF